MPKSKSSGAVFSRRLSIFGLTCCSVDGGSIFSGGQKSPWLLKARSALGIRLPTPIRNAPRPTSSSCEHSAGENGHSLPFSPYSCHRRLKQPDVPESTLLVKAGVPTVPRSSHLERVLMRPGHRRLTTIRSLHPIR